MVAFKFGSFDSICAVAPLQVCPLLGSAQGTEPWCYSRSVDIGGTLIFQAGSSRSTTYRRRKRGERKRGGKKEGGIKGKE
jgi:hypothetical protein